MSTSFPAEFVETMQTVTRCFPDLAQELRDPFKPGEPNVDRMAVWYNAIGSIDPGTVGEACRLHGACPGVTRKPKPSEIAHVARELQRRKGDIQSSNYGDGLAERHHMIEERKRLRDAVEGVSDDDLRGHLLMVAAGNWELRLYLAATLDDPRPVAEAHVHCLRWVVDRLEYGLGPEDAVSVRYGGGPFGVDPVGTTGVTEADIEAARTFDYKRKLIGHYRSTRPGVDAPGKGHEVGPANRGLRHQAIKREVTS